MVVPDSGNVVQTADNGGSTSGHMESVQPGYETEQELAGVELEEVRKLQDLVRRLEVQNQTLRNRGTKVLNGNLATTGSNINNQRTLCEGVTNSSVTREDGGEFSGRDFELSPQPDSSSNSIEDMSPLPDGTRLEDEDDEENAGSACFHLTCGSGNTEELSPGQPESSPSQESCESETLGVSGAVIDHSGLDEVEVLDLEDCVEAEDEDSW